MLRNCKQLNCAIYGTLVAEQLTTVPNNTRKPCLKIWSGRPKTPDNARPTVPPSVAKWRACRELCSSNSAKKINEQAKECSTFSTCLHVTLFQSKQRQKRSTAIVAKPVAAKVPAGKGQMMAVQLISESFEENIPSIKRRDFGRRSRARCCSESFLQSPERG